MTNLDDHEALGHESYHAGLLPTDNPFMEGFPQNIAWAHGYDAAKAAGPPVPAVLRRDALFNRATNALVKAGFGYLDALREYRASGGLPMDKHELYEKMLEFIEDLFGDMYGYARPESEE
jgi:hypothetical protein